MRRFAILCAVVSAFAAGGLLAQAGIGPIGNLQGRVDANNALVVRAVAAGATGSATSPIANLPGKVDASNNLLVALSGSQSLTGPLLLGDGTAAAPSYSFSLDPDTGIYSPSHANGIGLTFGGTAGALLELTQWALKSSTALGWSSGDPTSVGPDVILSRAAAGTLAQVNGTNAQEYRLGPAASYLLFNKSNGGAAAIYTLDATNLVFGTTNTARWSVGASSGDLIASSATGPAITQGAATGLTVNSTGSARDVVYKVTLATTAFVCAATTCDVTIGTLPANTRVLSADAAITVQFACTATCTSSTLSMVVGKGAGGAEYLASFDADAAVAWFGDADAEMGTLLTRAAAIQGGTFQTTSQAVVLRLTSGTGNIGNGAATNLSGGSVTVYLTTRVMP